MLILAICHVGVAVGAIVLLHVPTGLVVCRCCFHFIIEGLFAAFSIAAFVVVGRWVPAISFTYADYLMLSNFVSRSFALYLLLPALVVWIVAAVCGVAFLFCCWWQCSCKPICYWRYLSWVSVLAHFSVGGVISVFNLGVSFCVLAVFIYVVETFSAGGVIVCVFDLSLFVAGLGLRSVGP